MNSTNTLNEAAASPEIGSWNRVWRILLEPRLTPCFGWLEGIVLTLYAAVIAITIPFHEQWADEAQAWLIARDSSLWDIFYRRLHYEGSPGLWHLILWVATRLHLPYASIDWISLVFATAGTYVWLRYSPFPTVLRILFPFTFWVQYQYAVIARSYSVTPLLMFMMCALLAAKRPRPLVFALLAGLLANLSLYAFLWSGCFAVLYFARLWRGPTSIRKSSWVGTGVLLCTLFLFAFYTAFPAPDLPERNNGTSIFARRSALKDKIIPPSSRPAGWESLPPRPPARKSPFPPDTTLYTRGNALQRKIILLMYPKDPSYRAQTWGHRLQRLIGPFNALLYSTSESNLLGIALWGSCIAWLAMRRSLRTLVAVLPILVLATVTMMADHHAGLVLLTLITALWLPMEKAPRPRRVSGVYGVMVVLLLAVFLEQITWSADAVTADIHGAYDPGVATARFLREHAAGKLVIAFPYDTVSMTPFLPPHPFMDQPTSYWMWSSSVPQERALPVELKEHPAYVVVAMMYVRDQHISNQIVPALRWNDPWMAMDPRDLDAAGYHEITRFCGSPFMRSGAPILYCNLVYAPKIVAPSGDQSN